MVNLQKGDWREFRRSCETSRLYPFCLHGKFPPKIAILLAFIATVPAQTPDPLIRVNVDLVQVDAIVTDAKGHHLTNLHPEDFEIVEDNKPQKITNFSFIEVNSPAVEQKNTAPIRNPRKQDIHRTIAIMLDDAGTNATEILPILGAAGKFIDEKLAPGDMVSVTASRGGMGFYQQFTNDKRQMHAALDQIPQRRGWLICDFIPLIQPPGPAMGPSTVSCDPPDPFGFLMKAIQRLQDVPGRKAVVLFTGNVRFPAPPFLVDLANRAGVVIYVIDPTGFAGVVTHNTPSRALAEQTGGLYIRSAPGSPLAADLGEALEDMSSYYLLAYRPDRSDSDPQARHNIQIRAKTAGLIVRARNGNFGVPKTTQVTQAAPKNPLEEALFSVYAADGIRVRLNPLFAASQPDPKSRKRSPALRAVLEIDGRDVTFAESGGGNRKMILDVTVGVFNPDGSQTAGQSQVFTINVPAEKASQLATVGLQYSVDVPVSKPGPYQVRAAVRDEASKEIGSAYSFLSIPDFNLPQISLSSLVLSGGPGKPEWSEFTPGSSVQFGCELFGAKGASPKIDLEVRLFRGGSPVIDSQPVPAKIETTDGQTFLTGTLKIPTPFEVGDYALEVVAFDRLQSRKKQAASQWIDLTVVNPIIAKMTNGYAF